MVEYDLEALGRRAFAVRYRMLGSVVEAEDVAQEALLRLTEQGGAPNVTARAQSW
jgi:RNA polymerase sigma-70 factor, ECF subfamily